MDRRRASTWAVILLAVSMAPGAAAAQDASRLPDDPSKDVLLKNCGDCHMIDVVTGKRQSEADWRATITRMSGYGLTMSVEEVEGLIRYLARVQGLSTAGSEIKATPR